MYLMLQYFALGQLLDCAQNPCLNGGICDPAGCLCVAGYEGDLCEIDTDDCANNPCQYGGTCIDGLNAFTCNCFPSFFGTNCTESDCCYLDPCKNGGTCVDGLDNHTCICMPGYEGDNCEIETDECQTNPCQNGGICIDHLNSFTCDCGLRGFLGGDPTVCRPSDHCDPNPCLHGGTCHDQIDRFVCECTADYTGTTCNECKSVTSLCAAVCLSCFVFSGLSTLQLWRSSV